MLSKPRQPMGPYFVLDGSHGYHIDLRMKATEPVWSRTTDPRRIHWVGFAQWGLGCFDRHLAGDGERWRDAAVQAGDFLLANQERDGALRGAWAFGHPFPHTFDLSPPWVMSMAQGEAASLLVRLAIDTGNERYAEAAREALTPLERSVGEHGVRATLATGGVLFQEYPTTPPAHVLNGAMFTLFGVWDVWRTLDDPRAASLWDEGIDGLLGGLHLWDTGFWSRYDLYPHKVPNLASPFYHDLHIEQLGALGRLTEDARVAATRRRFTAYAHSPVSRARALAHKTAFRFVTPRRGLVRRRLRRLGERAGVLRP